jgi:hypothetical protein
MEVKIAEMEQKERLADVSTRKSLGMTVRTLVLKSPTVWVCKAKQESEQLALRCSKARIHALFLQNTVVRVLRSSKLIANW